MACHCTYLHSVSAGHSVTARGWTDGWTDGGHQLVGSCWSTSVREHTYTRSGTREGGRYDASVLLEVEGRRDFYPSGPLSNVARGRTPFSLRLDVIAKRWFLVPAVSRTQFGSRKFSENVEETVRGRDSGKCVQRVVPENAQTCENAKLITVCEVDDQHA
ncbi:hypothetical protein RP20_CCG016638 [Aedes albopictus]|nr:hypothetical protein RP20_CCG016638 [Aedes albopictus]